ncbi:hypothetical protein [Bacillus sp. P14.5]|uniref:hypothetical protein n=1 Tax=Bacillus sp. P14.5 TaxID=1983400 RepID=UPI0013B06B72|nr:hypothetical protein [Bacillus sp. P14.5]
MTSIERGGYTSERFSGISCPQKREVDTRVNAFQASHVLRRERWIHEWAVYGQLMSSEERGGYMSGWFSGISCPQKREMDTRVGGLWTTHVLRRERWIHEWAVFRHLMSSEESGGYTSERFSGIS